ncbi:MAG: hypothetical protein WA957_12725 [Alteraurantiacibacter sp.]
MADFRFYLERGNRRTREVRVDLPDATVVGLVAKRIARHYAAREICSGQLHMEQDVTVLDCNDDVVAQYPLSAFLSIDQTS